MTRPSALPARMDHPPEASTDKARSAYEEILAHALRYARRVVPHEQAFEIAHDVAVEMLRRPAEDRTSAPLLYLAVTSRRRNARRADARRAVREGAYVDLQSNATPVWAQPGADIEARELGERIRAVVQRMPRAMRDVFLLVREEELSYKEAAARLGISVGTVHTQLSRALALLRECVKEYHADEPRRGAPRPAGGQNDER